MHPFTTIGDTQVESGQLPTSLNPANLIMQGLAQFISVAVKVINAISDARAWTRSQQTLGERMIDQIPGMDQALFDAGLLGHRGRPGLANYVDSHYGEWTGNYGTIIPLAQRLMTILFGVRITNDEDLDALDTGADLYYQRPDKADIPRAAVDRAVFLKQNFFPISTYNTISWDMSKFEMVPYAAPIPGIEYGTLYNGEIPGGGEIKNGIVTMPGALVPGTGTPQTETNATTPGGQAATTQQGKGVDIGMLLVAVGTALIIFDNADT